MEIDRILLELFLIFVAAKGAGEIFERLDQPAVIGELLVGVALGPHALGVIAEGPVTETLQELGAIVLLFMVGLDTRLNEMRTVGGRALAVGSAGIVLPFGCGFGLMSLLDHPTDEALFVGAAMVATSVGITARVLADLGMVHERESRVILGAAVVDDVLGLLVLSVVSGLANGEVSPASVITLAFAAVGFVVVVGALGPRAVHRVAPHIDGARIKSSPLVAALAVCLGLSALAGYIGVAAIIGAFLAGMAFSDANPRWQLENQVEPVYQLLVPFFFVITGARVDLGVLSEPGSLALVGAITGLAIVGKLLGCGAAAWSMGGRSAAIVGIGMVPRGEVGIIVATVGLSSGAIGGDLYGVVVAMSILTTLVAPPVLARLFAKRSPAARRTPGAPRSDEVEGIGG